MATRTTNVHSDFFREMTLRICGDLDIDNALEHAFDYLIRHIPADAIGLGHWSRDQTRIRILSATKRTSSPYLWGDVKNEIVLPPGLMASIQAAEWPAFTVVNRADDPSAALLVEAFPGLVSHSAVFLRLDVQGEEIGALLLSAEGVDRFTSEHAHFLQSIREPFAIAMSNARRHRELQAVSDRLADDNRALTADLERSLGFEVVGADFGLREVMTMVRQVAPATSPVLLLGETGTGKEVIANAIHRASTRSAGPLVAMPCGAIPEALLDSELFGHERGAFTGAHERKRGRFERADGGTLFLDEIGELSLEAQVRLLRVLQERRFERLGGGRTLEVDVRIIAATHRDLEAMVRDGRFREDLWYRLAVLPIRIPPLRLRRRDIPALVRHFIERKSRELSLRVAPRVTDTELERLQAYDWPGNVRELQNVIERALILSRGDVLTFPDLHAPSTSTSPPNPIGSSSGTVMTMDQAIAAHIRSVLHATKGQIAGRGGAAELLDMNPSTLRFRIDKLGIER
ncbi:MAG: sigma 54-interacting transcriptional regulator [Acidobacteriota bacterium]